MPFFKVNLLSSPQYGALARRRGTVGQASVQGAVGATAPCYNEATLVNLRTDMVEVRFPRG